MAKITIQPVTVDTPWRHSSTSPQLRIFLIKPVVTSDSLVLENGSTQNGIFYRAYNCTVTGGKVNIPSITDIDSLTDALSGSDATYSAYFYASSSPTAQQVCAYQGFTRFTIPNLPATTTWAALLQFNATFIPFVDSFTYSRTAINAMIAGIVPVPLGGVSFILQAPAVGFSSAQALNSLGGAGVLKTDAGGHLSLAAGDTDYQKPISVTTPLTFATDTVGLAGLSTLGTANQVVGMNAGASGYEYKSLATGTSGTDFGIVHTANTVTFNLPTASGTNRGALASADWTTFNNKQAALTLPLSGAQGGTGVANTGFTLTLGGNLTTSGAFNTTFTVTGTTSVTLPTSGTLVNTGVTSLASLVTVGTIGTGIWQGTAVGQTYGGTGLDTHLATDGQILIGQTSDHTFGLATLTAGTNISITNAGHAITINSTAVAGSRWDQITAAAGDVTLANTTFKTTFTFGNINGAPSWSETYGALSGSPTVNQHTVLDLTGNTNLGALFNINTVGTSTALPLQVTAQGTTNGFKVDTSGIVRALGSGGLDAAAIITGTVPAARITQTGTITSGTWNATVIGSQYGGTGQNWAASNGLPSLNSGAWSLNTITTNGVAFGAASNVISFTSTGNNAVFLTSGAGVPVLGAVSANLSIASSTLDTAQGIQTTSSPRFAGLGIAQGAPSVTAVGITGATISTQASLSAMSLQTGGTLTSNDANTREFYDVLIQPTLNTSGGSNANKTFAALGFNIIETVVTGDTRFFIKAYINSVPGTVKWSVDDGGNEVLAGNLTAVNGTFSGTLAVTGAATLTTALTIANGGTGVTSLTSNGVLYGGTTVSATAQGAANSILTANAGAPSFSQTPTVNTSLTIGVGSSQAGSLILNNATNNNTVTITSAVNTASWTFKLPTGAGSNTQVLQTDGSGNTSWVAAGTGSGTVNSASQYQIGYWAANGTAISGLSALVTDANNGLSLSPSAGGQFTITQAAASSGSPYIAKLIGAAHTSLASGLEAIDVDLALNRTVTFTGSATPGAANIAQQREVVIRPATYAFTSSGAQTITNAYTLMIGGPPVAGTNCTITNPLAFYIGGGPCAQMDWLTIDMSAATAKQCLTVNATTTATGVANFSGYVRAAVFNVTNNGTDSHNVSRAIDLLNNNVNTGGCEGTLLFGQSYSQFGGNCYATDLYCNDRSQAGAGTVEVPMFGVHSAIIRKQAPTGNTLMVAFPFTADANGGSGTQKADTAYGFWGRGSFDFAMDQVRTVAGNSTPQTINTAMVRSLSGTPFWMFQNHAANANRTGLSSDASDNLLIGDSGTNAVAILAGAAGGGTLTGGTANNSTLTVKGTSNGSPLQTCYVQINPLVSAATIGTVCIGATGSADSLGAQDLLHLLGADGTRALFVFDGYHNSVGNAQPGIVMRSAQGTHASPVATSSADLLGTVSSRGYFTSGGTGFTSDLARMDFIAAEGFTSTAGGTHIAFETVQTTTQARTEAVRLMANGGLQLSNAVLTAPSTGDFVNSNMNSMIGYMSKVTPGRIVFAVNNGGTIEYLFITINGSGTTWGAQSGGTAP